MNTDSSFKPVRLPVIFLILTLLFSFLTAFTHKPVSSPAKATEDPLVLAVLTNYGQITRYFYDKDGHCVLKQEEYPRQTVETFYTYHKNGNLASEKRTDDLGTSIVQYDAQGSITRKGKVDKNGKTEFQEFYTNRYDNQKRLIETIRTDKAGTSRETTTFTYKTDGSFQVFYELGHQQDSFVPYIRKTAWFTSEGILTRENQEYSFGEHILKQTEILRNDKGDITEHRFRQDWRPSGSNKFESCYTYYRHTYDNQGKLTVTETTRTDYLNENGKETNSNRKRISKTVYSYDAAGRKIHAVTTSYEDQDSETVWEYDDTGNLILEHTTYADWDYTPETIWEYDTEGRLIRRKGIVAMSDLDFFLHGTGSQTYEADEGYTYLPLSAVLLED